MSNQTVLDAGQPPPLVSVQTDADGMPVTTIAEPDSEEGLAAQRHGNALAAVVGTAADPTDWGTYLRRVPVPLTGLAVAANVCTVGPGAVLAVQATTAVVTGPKASIIVGPAFTGQVLVEPQGDGTQRLTFNVGDAVTACAVLLLPSSAGLIAVLDADPVPPE